MRGKARGLVRGTRQEQQKREKRINKVAKKGAPKKERQGGKIETHASY